MAKIATPSRTSYRANAALDLVRNRACVTRITGMLECWSAGALKIPLLHFAIPSLLRCRSSRCILGDLGLRRERRVTCRPYTGGASELNSRRLAVSRWPEYPFPWMFFRQCRREPQHQQQQHDKNGPGKLD